MKRKKVPQIPKKKRKEEISEDSRWTDGKKEERKEGKVLRVLPSGPKNQNLSLRCTVYPRVLFITEPMKQCLR